MADPPWLAACRTALLALPQVASCEYGARDEEGGSVCLSVGLSGPRGWLLTVSFQHPRLLSLPAIILANSHALLAHVSYGGTVCYHDQQSVVIDPNRGPESVALAVSTAADVLEKSAAQNDVGDFGEFLDEFEGYWGSLPRVSSVESFVALDDDFREVVAVINPSWPQERCLAFVERDGFKHANYRGLLRFGRFQRARALYVPLTQPVLPPPPGRKLDASFLRDALGAVPSKYRHVLEAFSSSKGSGRRWTYALLSQPRSSGNRSAFAIAIEHRKKGGAFDQRAVVAGVRPLRVERHVAEHMRPRGGAEGTLATAHIVVIGCGAVGSRVAELLALAGIGTLTLFDPEVLSADNVYRHVLGGEHVGLHKVASLASHLKQRLPSIKVHPREELGRVDNLPPNVAAVVLAIGEPNQERDFNQRWRQAPSPKPMHLVVSWLEAAGLGGHALLSTNDESGCIECAYRGASGEAHAGPKVSYLELGQPLAQNLTGCGGSFTPYSALDAAKTAALAAELVVDALLKRRNRGYVSWRGLSTAATKSRLRVTDWYERTGTLTAPELDEALFACRCPICGAAP